MLFHFSLEIFNQNVIYNYYLVFLLQCFFLLDTHLHIHTYIGIHMFMYIFIQFLICQFELWNHITTANRASNSCCIKKRLRIQTMMIIIKFHDSENINISNMMLEWQNHLCNVSLYTSSIFQNLTFMWKCCQRNECSTFLGNPGITTFRAQKQIKGEL